MRISIILVNWNNAGDTINCLRSLVPATQGRDYRAQIIVVDNGSTDESHARLVAVSGPDDPGTITVLPNEANNGLAAGYNTGIRYAREHFAPDLFWLLNNDTTVDTQSLDHLVHAAKQHPEFNIWGSTIYTMSSPHALYCTGGFRYHTALSVPVPLRYNISDIAHRHYHALPDMDYVSGISMLVRAECLTGKKLLNEEYFLYYEELELVHQCGGKKRIAWCPASSVHHKGGGSTASTNPNIGRGSCIAHYYGNRSALAYTWKHHPWFIPLVFPFRLVAKSILFIRFGDWAGFKPLLRAYWDFLVPGGLKRRVQAPATKDAYSDT